MSNLAALGWSVLATVVISLLVLGVGNFASYRSTVPEKARSLAAVRASENDFRSIVAPAIAALVTGLLISLSASFAFEEIRKPDGTNTAASVGLFIGALALLLILLQPLMRGEVPLEKLAQHPQRIYLAADSVVGEEDDATERLETLKAALSSWWERRGTFAMGWVGKRRSSCLNEALAIVPATEDLPLRDAIRAIWRRRLVVVMIRTAPWRFGWPVAILPVPVVLLCADVIILGSTWPEWWPVAALVVSAVGPLSLAVYWVAFILIGVRRLAIAQSFAARCPAAIANAQRRTEARLKQQVTLQALPESLAAIAADLNRIDNTIRDREPGVESIQPLDRDQAASSRGALRWACGGVAGVLVLLVAQRVVGGRRGR